MRRVRCVSPHGGAHHGLRADNELPAPPGYAGALTLPPNEGGWVVNPVLGHVAVGDEVDAPEPPAFIADGFHFVDVTTGTGDVCQGPGEGCWCGGAHHAAEPASDEAARQEFTQAAQELKREGLDGGALASLLGKENS